MTLLARTSSDARTAHTRPMPLRRQRESLRPVRRAPMRRHATGSAWHPAGPGELPPFVHTDASPPNQQSTRTDQEHAIARLGELNPRHE